MFDCSKCIITLSSHEELKNHCHSKWHVFNHMRATQGRPPTTLEEFDTLALERLHHKQDFNDQAILSCVPCHKTFCSEGTFASHLQSHSHRTKAARFALEPTREQRRVELATPHWSGGLEEAVWDTTRLDDDQNSSDSDGSWEELDDEDEESVEDSTSACESWPCLLCPVSCEAAPDTLRHMIKAHSFNVPHREVCDLHSLYIRLADTVLQQRRCPKCGRPFVSVAAVQRHMTDKPHLSINPCSKQFRRCYRTGDLLASRLEMPRASPDSGVFELTLSNGTVLTPRGLALFARQRLRPLAKQPRARQRRLALQEAPRHTSTALQTTTGSWGRLQKQQVTVCRRRDKEQLSVATQTNTLQTSRPKGFCLAHR